MGRRAEVVGVVVAGHGDYGRGLELDLDLRVRVGVGVGSGGVARACAPGVGDGVHEGVEWVRRVMCVGFERVGCSWMVIGCSVAGKGV